MKFCSFVKDREPEISDCLECASINNFKGNICCLNECGEHEVCVECEHNMKIKQTKIISAFPCCGKTHAFEHQDELSILDIDSDKFKWKNVVSENDETRNETVLNPDFPNNYIEYIKSKMGFVDYILVGTSKEIRKALLDANLTYILVYPMKEYKETWVGRSFLSGTDINKCNILATRWDQFISELDDDISNVDNVITNWYRLDNKVYLSDVIEALNSCNKQESMK